jgi:thiol-disulfide isomerase/thioredoxin
MAILKAIGAFFVKIWRWIKETAWVQPLLIVGAIFAIIFSIPSITTWAKSISGDAEGAFYKKYQVSLEGEKRIQSDKASNSKADQLMTSLYDNTTFAYSGNNEADSATAKADYAKIDTAAYGEKFFVMFVGSDCSGCKTLEPGFKELRDNWKDIYEPSDGGSFNCYTIFVDESSSNDDSYTDPFDSAFRRMLENYMAFFNDTEAYLETVPYYVHEQPTADNYKYYGEPSIMDKKFVTPATLLVDYSATAQEQKRAGVSEILFGGLDSLSSSQAKAAYLMQMWNHCDTGDAGYDNTFCSNYKRS